MIIELHFKEVKPPKLDFSKPVACPIIDDSGVHIWRGIAFATEIESVLSSGVTKITLEVHRNIEI